jgi:hypothetical protein
LDDLSGVSVNTSFFAICDFARRNKEAPASNFVEPGTEFELGNDTEISEAPTRKPI